MSEPTAPRLGRFRASLADRMAERAIRITAAFAIAAVFLIFAFVVKEALPLFFDGSFHAGELFAPHLWRGYDAPTFVWQPAGSSPKLNVIPLLVGTLKVAGLTMLFSVPVGVACAVYVAQYAHRRVREVVKPVIELLAGVPSVVLGFFALVVLATVVRDAFSLTYRLNAFVAALALSLTVIPVIFTISEDALQSVPRTLSEASMALGARRWQTTLYVVLPAALPGIAASIVLGLGRAVGETMIVLMASGNAPVMELLDPTSSARTATATIAAEMGEASAQTPHWRVLFLLGALLFIITFFLNRTGDLIVKRLGTRLGGTVR